MRITQFMEPLPPVESYLPERILSGVPTQHAWVLYSSVDQRFCCGIWESERGKWRVKFDEHEFCHLLKGELEIVADDGTVTRLRPGDAFVTPAGFTGTWEVIEPARKQFSIYT